jgi:hypothetical protein
MKPLQASPATTAGANAPGAPGAAHPGGGGFLVLRRDGATWAVAQPEVQGLRRRGGAFEVRVAAGALIADEVLGVATALRLLPAGAVLRRFWPEAARGLGVHGALPLVLIDPSSPPGSLRAAAPGRPRGSREGEGEE